MKNLPLIKNFLKTFIVFFLALGILSPKAFGADVNIALSGTATQSSTGWNGLPTRAIDDNTNGGYWNNSVTHTTSRSTPYEWWQVDLGSIQTINKIDLFNRTDCCGKRLKNVWVMVSDTPFGQNRTAASVTASRLAANWSDQVSSSPSIQNTFTLPTSTTGRYVLIQKSGNNYQNWLSLAEVQVWSPETECISIGFEHEKYSIKEDINEIGTEKFVETHIILSQTLNYDVTLRYTTEDGTATVNNGDYRRKVDQLITIRAGDTNSTLPIGIYNDAPIELDENFFVQLSDLQPNNDICLSDINRTEIIIVAQDDAPICFEDHFDNGLDNKWRVLQSSGGFIPDIVNVRGDKRLRLTDKNRNLATTITKDYEFETSENLIIVEFDYHAYGGCGNHGGVGTYGADGIVNILFDSAVGSTPTPGGAGGSMGYAQWVRNTPGFEGGWLGLGIDEYGNFSNPTEKRIGGPGFKTNAIAIRGDGEGMKGYEFLAGATNLSPPVAAKRSHRLSDYNSGKYKMTIDARNPSHLYIRLERDIKDGNGYQVIINQFDAKDAIYKQGITPEKVRYAISSGTGGGCNNHELSWIKLRGNCAAYGQAPETGPFDAWDTFRHKSPRAPSDRNISTKIVEKPFQVKLVSLDSANTGYEVKTGIGSDVEVAIYQSNGIIPISNSVKFDASIYAEITSQAFTVPRAYEDAVVGFKICVTNEVNATTGQYVYRLWPKSSCSDDFLNDCTAPTSAGNPTWHICYSSDNFAIRPVKFEMTAVPNPIIGGNPYPIVYTVEDSKGKASKGYSKSRGGSFDITTELEPAMPLCQNNFIDINSNIEFNNGIYSGDTLFNTVGDFNLTLHEISGSEFAKVDTDDTPFRSSEERFIAPYTIDYLHIVPSDFTFTTTFTNANKDNNFTYLNNLDESKKMVSKLNITVQAIIKDGSYAENYESSCYADTTDLLVDYNYTEITPDNSLIELQYDKEATPTASGEDTISTYTGTDNNQGEFTIEDLDDTLFKDGNAGEANINLSINFDRKRDKPVNPFTLIINDITLTEDDNEVTSEEDVKLNVKYFFARVKASKFFYENVTESIITPISINVYCALTFAQCRTFGIDTVDDQTEDYAWWRSTNHSKIQGDGDATLIKGDVKEGASTNWTLAPTLINIINGTDERVSITDGSSPTLPLTVWINLDAATSIWLIYNKDDEINDPDPFYKVRFINSTDWAGVGETGHVLDTNASNIETKRLSW